MNNTFNTTSPQYKKIFFCIGLIFFFFGCDNSQLDTEMVAVYSERSANPKSLEMDTLLLNPLSFTEQGYFRVRKDSILFFDYLFLTVSEFNSEGEFVERYLGAGNGPDEIASFQYQGFMPDGKSMFLGTSYDVSIYSENWTRTQLVKFLDWGRTKNRFTKADINGTETYSFNFTNGFYDSKYLPINSKGEFYMSLWISPGINPSFHGYDGNTDYFKESYAIGLANANTGKVTKVFGKKPSQYQDYEITPLFDFLNYDLRNDSLYVTFAVADLIQVYSPSQKLMYEFGVAGTDMNKNYEEVTDIETSEKVWQQEYLEKGYYYHVFASDDNRVFRSYTKDGSRGGLQVYEGKVLVGDYVVPKRFSVIGRIGDYYYADGYMSEESDELGIYRFKLLE
jgi:hypothetical protein